MSKVLKGKVIVNFGDSIFGDFEAPTDISSFIAEQTGAKVHNIGFGGCRMSRHPHEFYDKFSMYRLTDAVISRDFSPQDAAATGELNGHRVPAYFNLHLKDLEGIDFGKVDIITIAYGTNDFTGEQMLEGKDKYDTNAFGGAMRYSVEKLKEAFPNIPIVICSQIYRYWDGYFGVYNEDSDTYVEPTSGYKLTDFVDKTKEIADEYGLFYIDNYKNSGINRETRHLCFDGVDTTHPIEYGRRLVAENISKELVSRFGN